MFLTNLNLITQNFDSQTKTRLHKILIIKLS